MSDGTPKKEAVRESSLRLPGAEPAGRRSVTIEGADGVPRSPKSSSGYPSPERSPTSSASGGALGALRQSANALGGTLGNLLGVRGSSAAEASSGSSPSTAASGDRRGSGAQRWSTARSSVLAYRGLGGFSTSYFLEKHAVVLDFGSALTKVGFATESKPRHILPTPELQPRMAREGGVMASPTEDDWIELLDGLLNKVFFHYLSVPSKDRRVVICDSVYSSVQFRNALAFVLFKSLSVPSVSFVVDLVLPLYLTGLSSGIVIDLGYSCSRVLVTFAGVPVLSAFRTATPGGSLVAARLKKSVVASMEPMKAALAASWLEDFMAIQDLLVSACYVPYAAPGGVKCGGLPVSSKSATFAPPAGEAVVVPAACRWEPCEIFFKGVDDEGDANSMGCQCSTVQEAFVQALESCPVDVRGVAVQNVVVVGGCASLRGMLPRLAIELQTALRGGKKTARMAERLRFTPLDFSPVCGVWTGGAVYGSLEGIHDFTAADYQANKMLPDWLRDGFV